MQLTLVRAGFYPKSTIGRLYVDGVLECYTLEDTVRPFGVKVDGATAIPYGKYVVVLDKSPKFGRIMPHVIGVPGFTGIRIHSGNTDADTEGCILVGQAVLNHDFLGNSRAAYKALFAKLKPPILLDIIKEESNDSTEEE